MPAPATVIEEAVFMNDRYERGSRGLTWATLKKVFPVAPSVRREHWDLLSRLRIEESQRNDDEIFYGALLHGCRGDGKIIFELDRRFLRSKKKKDREKTFSGRAVAWLRQEIPALQDYRDFFEAPAELFGEGTAERELRDMVHGLLRLAEEGDARSAVDVEERWEMARSELLSVLGETDSPTPEAVARIGIAAKALLEAGDEVGKLSAEIGRRRAEVRAALHPVLERAAEILDRLDTLDPGPLMKLARMAEDAGEHIEALAGAEARLAEKAKEFDRLRNSGAAWADIASQAGALADLEAGKNREDAALSAALTRMAAIAVPPAEAAEPQGTGPAPVSGAGGRKRRDGVQTKEPEPELPGPVAADSGHDPPDPPLPASWTEFPEWCAEHLDGRLALSGRARMSVKKALYEDVGAAARCLLWLGGDYRRSRLEGAGDGVQGPVPVGSGFRNERCGGDSFDFAWQGKRIQADWHVKSGGNSRNPERCLRIYYCWHEDREGALVVVGDMPGHVRSRMT